ncbi:MAG TPA: GNAT family N-acetyltransferase [Candidatus Nanopelagicales bacterium]|nr:GNAT family N-acetyltransferase [Candidatus Nanopelagicales bacterium]
MTELHVRPLRRDADGTVVPEDLDAMIAVFRAFEDDRAGITETTRAEVLAAMAIPRFSWAETVLLLEGDAASQAVVGAVFVMTNPDRKDVYVDPAVRLGGDERRLLEACADHAVAAARRIAAADGREGWTLRTGHAGGDELTAEVLASRGLSEVRRFYRMRIPSDSPAIPAARPPLPEGVELVVRDDDETRRALWLVDDEAFLDHWNYTPISYDDWWTDMSAGATRDPDGWWLLRVDGEPAAMLVQDESQAENGDGYVAVLAVRRPWRGRGLATWLLQSAFVRERDRGRAGIQLSVDAYNLTGAVRLYESVGMTPAHVRHGYALDL